MKAAAEELLRLSEEVADEHRAPALTDGTLTDSMYIWQKAPVDLVRRYGGDRRRIWPGT